MESPFLIAGLGNPGQEYTQTRHNAGFIVVERLAALWGVELRNETRLNACVGKCSLDGKRVYICEPQTYMNSSGDAVRSVLGFYKIAVEQLLVIVDDADLPLGQIRMRVDGSSGDHHGLESIEKHLGTRSYPRIRIGIGRTDSGVREIVGHVLGRFAKNEQALLDQVVDLQ